MHRRLWPVLVTLWWWWLLLLCSSHPCCHGFHIQQGTWTFLNQHPVAYERAALDTINPNLETEATKQSQHGDSTAILLLNGFGMGSFHQHRLMNELLAEHSPEIKQQQYVVYGMDYLGQGQSWPMDCNDGTAPSEQGLAYSARTWVNQIIHFIEEIILEPTNQPNKVHLVGNSVGGYLAVCVAAERPDLVASLSLLNATPIWGLNLPGWSGELPAPWIPRVVGRFLFDRMRDATTIRQFLKATYVQSSAYDDRLVEQIQSCTNGSGGHAAFASILWSPPVTVTLPATSALSDTETPNFYDSLEALQCDVLLLFGRDDPWCKPVFAKRMLERLERRNNAPPLRYSQQKARTTYNRYIELANVGHCPNHEAPKATALVLSKWLAAASLSHSPQQEQTQFRAQLPVPLLLGSPHMVVQEEWGETVLEERSSDQIPLGFMDRFVVQFV